MITLAQFKKFAPNSKYQQQWYDTLFGPQTELGGKSLLDEYQINTPKRVAAFIAQCAHESEYFSQRAPPLAHVAEVNASLRRYMQEVPGGRLLD